MEKQALYFENYLADIDPGHVPYAEEIHDFLVGQGCALKFQAAKNGLVISYLPHGGSKVLANFVSRKKGPTIRIYADHLPAYSNKLDSLPDGMRKSIEKAPVCRRLIDPAKCNARCPMGYSFTMADTLHHKCRYNCFMFVMDDGSNSAIRELLSAELDSRRS